MREASSRIVPGKSMWYVRKSFEDIALSQTFPGNSRNPLHTREILLWDNDAHNDNTLLTHTPNRSCIDEQACVPRMKNMNRLGVHYASPPEIHALEEAKAHNPSAVQWLPNILPPSPAPHRSVVTAEPPPHFPKMSAKVKKRGCTHHCGAPH